MNINRRLIFILTQLFRVILKYLIGNSVDNPVLRYSYGWRCAQEFPCHSERNQRSFHQLKSLRVKSVKLIIIKNMAHRKAKEELTNTPSMPL